ncbi:MAG: hypothetical protein K6C13_09430 [Oscillospiraceae bacterium]|nr:hypothetical protein [Oscillospiraceae bacterium]
MRKFSQFNEEICKKNLLLVLSEMNLAANEVLFKIIPDIDAKKPMYGEDSMFAMIVIPKANVDGKFFTIDQVSRLLSYIRDKGPTQVKVRLFEKDQSKTIVELYTSVRIRKPSQMANIETGHPPFRVIE